MYWAADLEYLEAMLKKFDLIAALTKEVLIWCFQKGLRLSIQAQINTWHLELDFWDKVLDKAIRAEFKAVL